MRAACLALRGFISTANGALFFVSWGIVMVSMGVFYSMGCKRLYYMGDVEDVSSYRVFDEVEAVQ